MLVGASAWLSQHPVQHWQTCASSEGKKSQQLAGYGRFTRSKVITNKKSKNILTKSHLRGSQRHQVSSTNCITYLGKTRPGQAEKRPRVTAATTSKIVSNNCQREPCLTRTNVTKYFKRIPLKASVPSLTRAFPYSSTLIASTQCWNIKDT